MPVIEQKTTNKNKVDFDLNRLDKSKTTIFSKYPKEGAALSGSFKQKISYVSSTGSTACIQNSLSCAVNTHRPPLRSAMVWMLRQP